MAVLSPVVTEEGLQAAFNASNTGTEIAITHIAFGTGLAGNAGYDPTGEETELENEVKRVAIAGGSRITPTQIRMAAIWQSEVDNYPIVEIGIYAGPILFAIWSRSTGGPLGFKTPGVDFIFSYDWTLTVIPPNSVTIVADAGQSAILELLLAHENDPDAHPQYLKIKDVAQDASRLYWAGVAGGTANALTLDLPIETELDSYQPGQVFRFIASATNTGAVTVNVEGLGVKAVTKNGSTELLPGDIGAGAVFEVAYDGTQFQLAGGVGSGFTFETFEFTAAPGQTSFSAAYTPGNVLVEVNGRTLAPSEYTATSGSAVVIPTVTAGQNVVIRPFRIFAVANVYTKAESDAKEATQAEAEALTIPGKWITPFTLGKALVSWLASLILPGVVGASRGSRMRVTAASATGTYNADELIVAASVGGRQWRLANITKAINLATTGAGGMDTGLAPASGFVALYVIYNPLTDDIQMLATDATSAAATQTYTKANMPAGYTASALVSVVKTNSSRQMLPHILTDRSLAIDPIAVLDGSTTQRASPTALSVAAAVPLNGRECSGVLNIGSSATALVQLNVGAMSGLAGQQSASVTGSQNLPGISSSFSNLPVPVEAPQTIHYVATASAGTMTASIFVSGYKI